MGIDARLLEVVCRRTGLPAADVHPRLWLGDPALGLDSVALLELVLECERACGRRLPSSVFQRSPLTVGELERALEAAAEQTG